MSLNSNLAFGPRLRAHRERRGLTLAALADSLKTKQSLLEQLERDDVTRWPPGIYGRALVREYAKLVDLPADDIVQQFVLLSGAGDEQPVAATARDPRGSSTAELRLTFAQAPARRPELLRGRVLAAAVELLLVLTAGFAVALLSGLASWTTNAMVALTWYPARAAFWDADAFSRILRLRRPVASWSHAADLPALDAADDLFIVETDVNTATSSSTSVH